MKLFRRVFTIGFFGGLVLGACFGCGPTERYQVVTPLNECGTLSVDNQNFADVVVYHGDQRLGEVTGKSEKDFGLCRFSINRPAVFRVRAIGRAFSLTLKASAPYVAPGSFFDIIVGSNHRISFIVG